MTDRKLPDKAIDVLDEVGAATHLASREEVGIEDVETDGIVGAAGSALYVNSVDAVADAITWPEKMEVFDHLVAFEILESTARVIGNLETLADAECRLEVDELLSALESVLRARAKRYLMANVRRDRLDEVRKVIPGINGPTIVEILDGGDWVAAHAVVEQDRVYQTINRLKAIGAEGILVTRIERLMP